MGRTKRRWNKEFLDYMKDIEVHPHYKDMPDPIKEDDGIRWVVTGCSKTGRARLKWWDQKRESLGIPKGEKWQSKVSRANHPTGEKPCQVCGRILKLDYVYPNKTTIKRINKEFKNQDPLVFEDLLEMEEVVSLLLEKMDEGQVLNGLARVFKNPHSVGESLKSYTARILVENKTRFSPGAMSDCPDRFDGYHTYNLCCRAKEDKGRHADNLKRYGEDRRAYEYWSDGDWKAAFWLMRRINTVKRGRCCICGKVRKPTADHLGPISLGFSLGNPPKLRFACKPCNSGRNNRMTYADIRALLNLEKDGAEVASWHSKYVWNTLKKLPSDDEGAKLVSRLMRLNLDYVFKMLGQIDDGGHREFLRTFLHPEYALYTIRFPDFDESTGTYTEIVKEPASRTEQKRNAIRYDEISFESLAQYSSKKNRKMPSHRLGFVKEQAEKIVFQLDSGNEEDARRILEHTLGTLAGWAKTEFAEEMARR